MSTYPCCRPMVRCPRPHDRPMMRWVGLVRNVMLGRDGLDRARLLDTLGMAGGCEVRSYLTTGNVTFDADAEEVAGLGERLEVELARIVSRPTMVAIREHGWLRDLVTNDLFSGLEAGQWEFEVAFLRHTAAAVDTRSLPDTGRTRLVAVYERERPVSRQPHEVGPRSAELPRTPESTQCKYHSVERSSSRASGARLAISPGRAPRSTSV
jgi:uncharacterized protein (DUF1697 family)